MSDRPTAEKDAPRGLHPCVDCGLELDADDLSDRCEECEVCAICGRDDRNGTHAALVLTGHLSHPFTRVIPPGKGDDE